MTRNDLVAAALTLAACNASTTATSPCQRLADSVNSTTSKSNCASITAFATVNVSQCGLACSTLDQMALTDTALCLDGLPKCSTTGANTFAAAVDACAADLATVSSTCISSLNLGTPTNDGGTTDGGTKAGGTDGGAQSEDAGIVGFDISFSPMFSASDGVHTYVIPAMITGSQPTDVTWTASDSSLVTFATDAATGGVLITTHGSGTTTIEARVGGIYGTSVLTIDAASVADWTTGQEVFTNGVTGGAQACASCHTPGSTGAYTDVGVTPQQVGGFSDSDLSGIIQDGTVPDGGYFDPAIVPYAEWESFHQYALSADDLQSLEVYLRSLTPTPQSGAAR